MGYCGYNYGCGCGGVQAEFYGLQTGLPNGSTVVGVGRAVRRAGQGPSSYPEFAYALPNPVGVTRSYVIGSCIARGDYVWLYYSHVPTATRYVAKYRYNEPDAIAWHDVTGLSMGSTLTNTSWPVGYPFDVSVGKPRLSAAQGSFISRDGNTWVTGTNPNTSGIRSWALTTEAGTQLVLSPPTANGQRWGYSDCIIVIRHVDNHSWPSAIGERFTLTFGGWSQQPGGGLFRPYRYTTCTAKLETIIGDINVATGVMDNPSVINTSTAVITGEWGSSATNNPTDNDTVLAGLLGPLPFSGLPVPIENNGSIYGFSGNTQGNYAAVVGTGLYIPLSIPERSFNDKTRVIVNGRVVEEYDGILGRNRNDSGRESYTRRPLGIVNPSPDDVQVLIGAWHRYPGSSGQPTTGTLRGYDAGSNLRWETPTRYAETGIVPLSSNDHWALVGWTGGGPNSEPAPDGRQWDNDYSYWMVRHRDGIGEWEPCRHETAIYQWAWDPWTPPTLPAIDLVKTVDATASPPDDTYGTVLE